MKIEVLPATLDEKPILRNLLELYEHDLSEYEGRDVGPSGLYGYRYLDHYWTDAGRDPFLVRVDDRLAGFVLVNTYCLLCEGPGAHSVAEFFILRRYRRRGVGAHAARAVFDLFPGRWEVRQLASHPGSHAFWQRVIGDYTGGRYAEVVLDDDRWRGPVQTFDTPAVPPAGT